MPKILVCFDHDQLKKSLSENGSDYKIINFDHNEDKIVKLLISKYNLTELDNSFLSGEFNEKFRDEYLKLIQELGVRYNSKVWWATWISSKNRFNDKLFNLVYFFAKIVHLYETNKWKKLLLISPPREILSSLKRYCREQDIQLKILGNSLIWKLSLSCPIVDFKFFYNFINLFSSVYPRMIISKRKFKLRMEEVLKKKDRYFLIKTFVYDRSLSESENYSDAYFGMLPDYLKKNGKRLIIVGSFIGNFNRIASRLCKNHKILVVPEEYFLNFISIVRACLEVYFKRIIIENPILFNSLNITEIVRDSLANEFLNYLVHNFCYFEVAKNMAKKIELETVLITHENNSWEKMYIMALRKYSPNTAIIGFQHAVIPPSHLGLVLKEKERKIIPLPDKIITSGEINRNILITHGGYDEARIVIGCALKQNQLFTIPRRAPHSNNIIHHILVGLEGVWESVDLMNFVFDALKDKTDYTVRFRAHPALPLSQLEAKTKFKLNGRLSHFERSQNPPLFKDLQWADLMVYSGSTVALEALMYGIPVINVDIGHALNIDPCFECNHFKRVVNTPNELIEAIQYFVQLEEEQILTEQKSAQEYTSKYFYSPTDENLKCFINPFYGKTPVNR